MGSMFQFSRNIRTLASRIENNSASLIRRVSKRTLKKLVNGTPVDTGEARSNWRVSLGNPTRSVIPPHAPGKHLGIHEKSNAKATIQEGFQTIEKLKSNSKGGAVQSLYITNSIPFLDRLRNGYSAQQPNDWVEEAFVDAKIDISKVSLLTTKISDDEDDE